MKLSVLNNAKRNIAFGILNKLVVLFCPFIIKATIIRTLGAEYLGLNGLFNAVLSVLSLSELGFGFAVTYCMYKPVAENDTNTVNAILNFYRKTYHIIGAFILGLGLALSPAIPKLISGSYPNDINPIVLFVIYIVNSSASYFLFAYRQSLIIVYQRNDIESKTNMLVTIVLTIVQMVILIICKNYTVYILTLPMFTVINNLRIAYITKKMFPQYHCTGNISQSVKDELKKKVGGIFISKVCMVARNSLDSVCISMFLGLVTTAQYNNYFYILTGVSGFISIISDSFLGGIGNHVVSKSENENYREFNKMDFSYMWLSGVCTVCILCLTQPFMKLWMGKEMLFSNDILFMFVAYFYLLRMGDIKSIYINAKGLWWELKSKSIAEAISNFILNIVLAKFFGVYGILIATLFTVFIFNYIWGAVILFKSFFISMKVKDYFISHIKYFLVTFLAGSITLLLSIIVRIDNEILVLLIRLVLCLLLPNVFYYFVYHKSKVFIESAEVIKGVIRNKVL